MVNGDDCLRSFCASNFGNGVKAMMKTKMKTPTYHYKLATTFNTLQQHVAQHPMHYSLLMASFNNST